MIVVNWNGLAFLDTCLESLDRQRYGDFEVVVVDNGSSDGSVEFLRQWEGPSRRVIFNRENTGFAAANNQGIRATKGRFVATLNNDTRTDPGWIEGLVATAETDQRVGMVASKILVMEDSRFIDSVGHQIFLDGSSRGRGRLEEDAGQYERAEEVLFPSACAALSIAGICWKTSACSTKGFLPTARTPISVCEPAFAAGDAFIPRPASCIITIRERREPTRLVRFSLSNGIAFGWPARSFHGRFSSRVPHRRCFDISSTCWESPWAAGRERGSLNPLRPGGSSRLS